MTESLSWLQSQDLVRVELVVNQNTFVAYEYENNPGLVKLPCETGSHEIGRLDLTDGFALVCHKCSALDTFALNGTADVEVTRTVVDDQHTRANLDMVLYYQMRLT